MSAAAAEYDMDRETRLLILNDSDVAGCLGCGAPLPEDFVTNQAWFADLLPVHERNNPTPSGLAADVRCPECW